MAIAAQQAITHHQLSLILIVDWDVHHGNGGFHVEALAESVAELLQTLLGD